MDKWF